MIQEPEAVVPGIAARDVPFHVADGDRAALARIGEPDVTLALWRRPPPVAIGRLDGFATVRVVVAVADVARALADAGCSGDWRDAVRDDAAMLAGVYAQAVGASRVAVRLDRVATDACRRFHADHVGVRLISTYCGRGTEWLPQGTPADAVATATQRLAAGDVGLFKGRLAAGDTAIIHRSPPIAALGEERLLLVIDAA